MIVHKPNKIKPSEEFPREAFFRVRTFLKVRFVTVGSKSAPKINLKRKFVYFVHKKTLENLSSQGLICSEPSRKCFSFSRCGVSAKYNFNNMLIDASITKYCMKLCLALNDYHFVIFFMSAARSGSFLIESCILIN